MNTTYEEHAAYATMPPLATGACTATTWASCPGCTTPITPGQRAAYLLTGALVHSWCAASAAT